MTVADIRPTSFSAPPKTDIPRVDVLGVGVSAINLDDAVSTIRTWVAGGRRSYVCVTGVHGVMESQDDPALRDIHNRAGLVTPDGMPLVWLLKHAGHRGADRVYGPDLMAAVFADTDTGDGPAHFLYGSTPEVLERLSRNLQARFPGCRIAGTFSPPFRPLTDAEEAEVAARINASGAGIVWVGLSTPKQERWMAAHRPHLTAPVLVGVGAAFDFHAGLKRQAPRVIQRSGFEWLFRLATEPRRLWRRYATNNPRFVVRIAGQLLRRPRPPAA
ncbi:N-acetylglucosaminyldiphosphoundecaprenol N-acetyl-beta-D-mannosaminyltransferase [Azospirillum fermentarium]|uniref:WecB/TagA/CpsF family glycosyltransferase n=1 Tax=Azospirillum fermentarium TaxID=1233114 RepID=UPI00222693F2|nr:WecB/TagA/CpsF family glycosyltransferase [Azospirillum fermentarium]MCW2248709.1 N-acetylglucosaminyldiphosphoundecaprenol N-acetyl-beta-D-mannosaminyltransferase [Azospirillum fermentarium]